MLKTFNYKIYVSKRNRQLVKLVETAAEIWNFEIALQRRYYRFFKKRARLGPVLKHLARKRNRTPHWKALGAQTVQDIARRIDRGYLLFFRNLKVGKRASPPKFRSRFKYHSFTLTQAGWKLRNNTISVFGTLYKFALSRPLEGLVKTVTIKRNRLGEFFVHFCCESEDETVTRVMTGESAGFDFGLKTFLTSNNGERIESPQFLKRNLDQIRKASKALSKKKKGSANRERARLDLARKHLNIANRREDWQWKLALSLAKRFDHIAIEDLDISGLRKRWGRKTSDLGFYGFVQKLGWQCRKLGTHLVQLDRYFPSSQLCSVCGHQNRNLSLRDRKWTCVCGAHHDRDVNAARNIYQEGSSSCSGGSVRLASVSMSC